MKSAWKHTYSVYLLLGLAAFCKLWRVSLGLRALKDTMLAIEDTAWLEQNLFTDGNDVSLGPYPMWNISGTYKGKWFVVVYQNSSTGPPNFHQDSGNVIIEMLTLSTNIYGVHYVQGEILFPDGLYMDNANFQVLHIKMEGVYVWQLRQLRMVLSGFLDGDKQSEDFIQSNAYHLLGIFSSQLLQDSSRKFLQDKGKKASMLEMGKNCRFQMASELSQVFSEYQSGKHGNQAYTMQGLLESPLVNGDGECFSSLVLNVTSIEMGAYHNKAINYTLMVTFISFLQVLSIIKQMEHSSTQSGASKVSLLMMGQQAIVDAYLCLLHLTAGILIESLFNAFATAAFFKFVLFSIFEMRYLLAIWKSQRSLRSSEGWEAMRRELSVLYSRFYGVLLGGILIMYEFHGMLRYILFLFYSFWIPQIASNVVHNTRKPLHPYYISCMTITRLAIPLYAFGCPKNFMRIDTNIRWCCSLAAFVAMQAVILLLQHFLGGRWFIPHQLLPEKHCYFRMVESKHNQNVDCVICMASVETSQCLSELMVTPCNHFFHSSCLQRWMDIKMDCPTCRSPLPPL